MSIVYRTYDHATNKEIVTSGAYAGQVISIFQKVSRDLDGWEQGTFPVACVWVDGVVRQVACGEDPDTNFADLTAENLQEYLQAIWNACFEYHVNNMTNSSWRAAQVLNRGDRATIVRGRKHPKGTTGVIVGFSKPNSFGITKVGLATSDRTEKVTFGRKEYDRHLDVVWVDQNNVEKCDWQNALPSQEEIDAEAKIEADTYLSYLENLMEDPRWITWEAPNPQFPAKMVIYR